jgi:mRNA interferase YafQ
MLKFETTTKFDRDMKRIIKRGLDLSLMDTVIQMLIEEKPLDAKHKDHALKGNYIVFRKCHILPDWLLIYTIDHNRLILTASRTGTHSDLF